MNHLKESSPDTHFRDLHKCVSLPFFMCLWLRRRRCGVFGVVIWKDFQIECTASVLASVRIINTHTYIHTHKTDTSTHYDLCCAFTSTDALRLRYFICAHHKHALGYSDFDCVYVCMFGLRFSGSIRHATLFYVHKRMAALCTGGVC